MTDYRDSYRLEEDERLRRDTGKKEENGEK